MYFHVTDLPRLLSRYKRMVVVVITRRVEVIIVAVVHDYELKFSTATKRGMARSQSRKDSNQVIVS